VKPPENTVARAAWETGSEIAWNYVLMPRRAGEVRSWKDYEGKIVELKTFLGLRDAAETYPDEFTKAFFQTVENHLDEIAEDATETYPHQMRAFKDQT
jgi:hypothetical protein